MLELDFRDPGACELAFFGLTAAMQRRGVGRAMMRVAVDRAFAKPIERLLVHTCTLDSPAALPFYLRSGFRAVRREVEIFADPRLGGLLPRRRGTVPTGHRGAIGRNLLLGAGIQGMLT